MATFEANAYLILERDHYGIRIADMRKNKPALRAGQVAVRINLSMDSKLFEQIIPRVSVELKASDIIEPIVEVFEADSDTTK